MPVQSEAQRKYLYAHFGKKWVKEHHFDQKGKLPEHKNSHLTPHHKLREEIKRAMK